MPAPPLESLPATERITPRGQDAFRLKRSASSAADRRDHRHGVGSGIDDRGYVVPGDAADGHNGDIQPSLKFCQAPRTGEVDDLFALGGVHGAEADVVGAVRFRPDRLVQGVGGDADDLLRSQEFAGSSHLSVVLPQMHAVGVQFFGHLQIVVDDEGRPGRGTELFQFPGQLPASIILTPLVPVLDDADPTVEGSCPC